MISVRQKNNRDLNNLGKYFKSKPFQRLLIGIVTILIALAIVENGAIPKKYSLKLGDKSPFDITAPRDIENEVKTLEKAIAAKESVPPVMKRLDNVPIDVLNKADDFLTAIEDARKSVEKSLQDQGINKKDKDYKEKLGLEQALGIRKLNQDIKKFGIPLSEDQVGYLISRISDGDLANFKRVTRELISLAMKEEINESNIAGKINQLQSSFQSSPLSQELKNIGGMLAGTILKPNSAVDEEQTEARKEEAYKNAFESKEIIPEGARIISYGDVVTEDKLQVLEELSLLETGKFDYTFAAGILIILLLLTTMLFIYMHFFCRKILYNRSDLVLLSVIIVMTLLVARVVYVYNTLLIPIFIAPMLISILLDLKLAIVVNFILTIAISFITKNDLTFIYMSMISGTFSAFTVSRANQRSKLSASGLLVAGINILIIVSMGILNKSGFSTLASEGLVVSVNGIVSIVLTIGLLPFLESTFNIITPLKLLELANPNQPLIKRLLMEAPGTYHHSLMVGNLAEVATEAIEGNALLARVGAYYHDVGKLKRPNFFIENQLSDNPHDRMTANLSTLVITSHTHDGAELAEKFKIPLSIREIICQHHGTTLVAYFYHKAKKSDRGETVKQEDFRYSGPRPSSKEAAVVMLADSVEAAVRSMIDKTEGKIEGLVRKIIKDKLDDGQLDQCDLTLSDLDVIAKSFMRVFSGFFHEREEYPEVKIRKQENNEGDSKFIETVKNIAEDKKQVEEEVGTANGNYD